MNNWLGKPNEKGEATESPSACRPPSKEESGTKVKKKKDICQWRAEEECELIQLYFESESQLKGAKNLTTWNLVANELNGRCIKAKTSLGSKSGIQCRTKWRNLLTKYRDVKTKTGKTGEGKKNPDDLQHTTRSLISKIWTKC